MYLRRSGWTDADEFTILTKAGPITPTIRSDRECTLEMGRASTTSQDFPSGSEDGRGEVEAGGRTWAFQHVSIGNPQCAIAVASLDELDSLDLPLVGPPIEGHPEFPNRTNVSWFAELDPGDDAAGIPARIRARIFERGVGETLSSGTGATGAAVAYLLAGPGGRPPGPPSQPARVIVVLDGGELEVEVGPDLRVHLSGWALPVFAGTLSEPFLEQLHQIN
jgi:diaminopimelate epimerase